MSNNDKQVKKVPCEVYSRIVGYLRPVQTWNIAKQQEFKDRKVFRVKTLERSIPDDKSDIEDMYWFASYGGPNDTNELPPDPAMFEDRDEA